MNEFKNYEGMNKSKSGEANMVVASSSSKGQKKNSDKRNARQKAKKNAGKMEKKSL